MERELKCKCGCTMIQEDRDTQFERIKKGINNIFKDLDDRTAIQYTRNYIGYGPNYMFKCAGCARLIKFIPDGRKRDI
jgi:hypothetical protein